LNYSKHTGFGFAERFRLVEEAFPGAAARIRNAWPVGAVSDDDILDALAALWTARRLQMGVAVGVGDDQAHDEQGLPMQIWA
jgi:predicted RNase H-like nuclease